ncbi:unnamed protein product [Colias eurytheme]|nr:unnamed protein product [Colias eurytheme]
MEKSARPRTALNECVKVVVRCRPLSEKEKNDNYEEVKKSSVEKKWYERLSTKQTAENKFEGPLQVVKVWPERGAVQVNNPKGQDKLFTYDAAYDCTADTKTIYDEMDIENMLSTWLEDNNTKKWSEGLRFVQLMKNRAHHTGINCTPYEAMFGTKLKVGLKSSSIPHEALLDINSEEDLEKLLSTESTITERNQVVVNENDQEESAKNDQVESAKNDQVESAENDQVESAENDQVESAENDQVESAENDQLEPIETDQVESTQNDSNPIPTNENENLERKKENVMAVRKLALQNLQKQANKMLDVSSAKYPMAAIGDTVRPLVASVLDGFNGCVFAYGQTGTGKTHTMEGTPDDEGIIPRTFRHMWAHIENTASPDVTHLVSCSFVELYLEDVRDLLSKECKKLTIRGQELNGFYIPEMTSIVCKSAAEMVRVMRAGNRNRAAGRTDMNEHSSRSHAVFLVTVETAHRSTNRIRVGKLNLVDLAGSERQRKTGASADRLREAARINQALSSLGNVISALAENSPHVPYRDSKLTRILQDSLGGNSKTIMIANIGPACYNYDETVTTLRYAHRAKAIKNKPVRNEDPKDAKLREYQAEIERLRSLIEQRKAAEKRKKPPKPRVKNMPESEEDTAIIETEHILAASTIEQEKTRTEELEHQIRSLEERLVQGGGGKDLLNNLNESQVILEQRHMEIAERKKREIEMQQKIDLEEETTAIVTNTFTTLQQEVDHKTQRLARCLQKYAALREEAVEQREAHDAERREHEALQAALLAALRRRLLLADSFVPAAGRHAVLRLRYDDDADAWDLPPGGAEPLTVRPVALPGSRRPVCGGLAGRRRADNLLELRPLPLPSTVRHYPPPPHPAHPAHTAHPPTAHTHARSLSAAKVIKSVEAPMKKDIPESRRVSAKPRPPSALHRLGTAGVR